MLSKLKQLIMKGVQENCIRALSIDGIFGLANELSRSKRVDIQFFYLRMKLVEPV